MVKRKRVKVSVSPSFSKIISPYVYGERESSKTILIKRYKLPDSDRIIITDKNGYRYMRHIPTEKCYPEYMFFEMI